MLIFVHNDAVPQVVTYIDKMNTSRISPEVLSLHLVPPTRQATQTLAEELRKRPALHNLEKIHRLRPNNAVRDLTAPWRLHPTFAATHHLLVNLETVCPAFRHKYPDPNITLPAGGVEPGETPYVAAQRELLEETRVRVHPSRIEGYVGLFRGGIRMFTVVVTTDTPLIYRDGILHIGWSHDDVISPFESTSGVGSGSGSGCEQQP